MHLTRRLSTTAAAFLLATALSTAPPATAAPTASAPCTSMWEAVHKAAVRKPAGNEGPVATTVSPLVRYLRRGEKVRSCVVAIGRGGRSAYRECGGGSQWRIVLGGQVPARCLKRARP
ncbi:hypothetical protein ACFV5G_37955 [Streptomyces sp. NPDC059766]|uniref:hypothetical protein n=1 Tax=Streptomyces sp. NPDC059766 TaxID=3346940 RepID=UPI003661AFC5